MNNKGFTLIELIITIALLAIITTISFVSINGIIKQSKVNNCNTLVNNIITATNEYVSDHRYNNLDVTNFDASKLINGKYLSGDIYNPFTKEIIDPSEIKISVQLNDDYTFQNAVIIAPEALKDCNG